MPPQADTTLDTSAAGRQVLSLTAEVVNVGNTEQHFRRNFWQVKLLFQQL